MHTQVLTAPAGLGLPPDIDHVPCEYLGSGSDDGECPLGAEYLVMMDAVCLHTDGTLFACGQHEPEFRGGRRWICDVCGAPLTYIKSVPV